MSDLLKKRKELSDSLMREAVESAAVTVLRQRGLAGLTMDAVAEAAGLAKGTLYNYFRNKEELLVATHERLFGPLREQVEALMARQDLPATEILRSMVRAVLDFVEQDRPLLFVLYESPELASVREQQEAEFVEELAAVLRRGVEAGELRPMDPASAAWLVFGVLSFACKSPVERPALCPPVERMAELVVEFILHGVARGSE